MSRVSRPFPLSLVAKVVPRYFRCLTSWLLPACLTLLWHAPAHAQFNCPAPWATAANAYGIILVSGTGSGQGGGFTQTVNQSAITAGNADQFCV